MTIDAIVLAGGAATRFGSDKLAAELDGRPLLHHALEAVAMVADRIVVVVSPDAPQRALPASVARRTVLVRDAAAHRGPLAGLMTGLGEATPADAAIVVGGDMPRLVPAVLRLLVDRLVADPLLGAVTLDAEPAARLPMVIRPTLVAPVARSLLAGDRRSLRALLDRVPSAVVPAIDWRRLDPDGATLVDIDIPADLASG
jgi:molybdopterin-guanine dinucleotide biosynthesis protein A